MTSTSTAGSPFSLPGLPRPTRSSDLPTTGADSSAPSEREFRWSPRKKGCRSSTGARGVEGYFEALSGAMTTCDVAVIGAGPYGLSGATHLRAANGLVVRVFGEPMSFWERHVPAGMLLRSPWAGSHISDPKRELTLDTYHLASNNHPSVPVPVARFIDYGHWFQRHAVPDVDRRKVITIKAEFGSFGLALEDGEPLKARRVVIAAGIAPFARRPVLFRELPSSLASHTSEHRDLNGFAGKEVVVVGGGQSAL